METSGYMDHKRSYIYMQGPWNDFYPGGVRINKKIILKIFLLYKSLILGGVQPSQTPPVPRPLYIWTFVIIDFLPKIKLWRGWIYNKRSPVPSLRLERSMNQKSSSSIPFSSSVNCKQRIMVDWTLLST